MLRSQAFGGCATSANQISPPSRREIVFMLASCTEIPRLAGSYAPRRGQSAQILFPRSGEVNVVAEVHPAHLPEIVFTSQASEKELARLKVGVGVFDPKHIGLSDDSYPIIRFRALHVNGVATPIVFAAAMDAGGSDCTYAALVAGEVEGQIVPLSPRLPMVNAEGGYAIRRGAAGVNLFAWNFIWGPNESHVDPHDYWVQAYRWEAGRFVFSRRFVVKKSEPEISYPNLLRGIKDFEC